MTTIYDQHKAAFPRVAAYVVLKGDTLVARVAFKFAASGMRTTAFVHFLGVPMVKGIANGADYDKPSASIAAAARKIEDPGFSQQNDAPRYGNWQAFVKAASLDNGKQWGDALRAAGFTVLSAI